MRSYFSEWSGFISCDLQQNSKDLPFRILQYRAFLMCPGMATSNIKEGRWELFHELHASQCSKTFQIMNWGGGFHCHHSHLFVKTWCCLLNSITENSFQLNSCNRAVNSVVSQFTLKSCECYFKAQLGILTFTVVSFSLLSL